MPDNIIKARINDETLRNDLQEIATERFEGNMSMLLRLALREFRDRHRPRARRSSEPDGLGLSS